MHICTTVLAAVARKPHCRLAKRLPHISGGVLCPMLMAQFYGPMLILATALRISADPSGRSDFEMKDIGSPTLRQRLDRNYTSTFRQVYVGTLMNDFHRAPLRNLPRKQTNSVVAHSNGRPPSGGIELHGFGSTARRPVSVGLRHHDVQ